MKKKLAIAWASYFIIAAAATSLSAYKNNVESNSSRTVAVLEKTETTYSSFADKQLSISSSIESMPDAEQKSDTSAKKAVSTSRGGNPLEKPAAVKSDTNNESQKVEDVKKEAPEKTETKKATSVSKPAPPKSKIETLDWWKQAQKVFPRGATATVQDVYTGKTFKVVRTMGTNHADSEAASSSDTKIIKSIWGGFSWTRRPVIVIIGERRLAASMTAMPHAGLDSLPAYSQVKNRSGGYGSGQNLDVVKHNDMDGHFDIHFLNSTRHKDGQADPQHQAMIKVAASKK